MRIFANLVTYMQLITDAVYVKVSQNKTFEKTKDFLKAGLNYKGTALESNYTRGPTDAKGATTKIPRDTKQGTIKQATKPAKCLIASLFFEQNENSGLHNTSEG